MRKKHGIADTSQAAAAGASPLAAFGPLDDVRSVMRAYALYRYNLFKEKYIQYGSITR